MRLVTAEEMRKIDQKATEEYGISSLILMENAGNAAFIAIKEKYGSPAGKRFAVCCGGGNCGGDGFVLARRLALAGAEVRLFLFTDPKRISGDALINYRICRSLELEMSTVLSETELRFLRVALINCDYIVDAILGTGFTGELRGILAQAVELFNNNSLPIIAMDIPTGLTSDQGSYALAVQADLTVTMGAAKLGMLLAPAKDACGELVVADISIPDPLFNNYSARREYLNKEFCKHWLPKRIGDVHKGDFGKVVICGGSENMWGAPLLAAGAALRTGTGLLYLACPEEMAGVITMSHPEAMRISPKELTNLPEEQVLAFGMGLGRDYKAASLFDDVISSLPKNAVLDADALWHLANLGEYELGEGKVITPHYGEAAKLLNCTVEEITSDRIDAVQNLAVRYSCVAVLKGENTLIASPDGTLFVNSTGNAGLATGGSGDVLSGMIAALLAGKLPTVIAAAVGVYLHGLAGDIAAIETGEYALIAGDIINNIGKAIKVTEE